MDFVRVTVEYMEELKQLQTVYKSEIGEESPSEEDFERLRKAVDDRRILFFGCVTDDRLVACCSVSHIFSTFDYRTGGVFEDFCILPEYRRRGIARKLVDFARRESGVSSLTVGCADCDTEMYKSLGFSIPIGNMLAFGD